MTLRRSMGNDSRAERKPCWVPRIRQRKPRLWSVDCTGRSKSPDAVGTDFVLVLSTRVLLLLVQTPCEQDWQRGTGKKPIIQIAHNWSGRWQAPVAVLLPECRRLATRSSRGPDDKGHSKTREWPKHASSMALRTISKAKCPSRCLPVLLTYWTICILYQNDKG